MDSVSYGIVSEKMRRVSIYKRVGAVVYGLCLTAGLLFILRPELVENFGVPIVYFYGTKVEASFDNGATWLDAQKTDAASRLFTLEVPKWQPPEKTVDVSTVSALSKPGQKKDLVLLRPIDTDVTLVPGQGAPLGVEVSTDGGLTWQSEPKKGAGVFTLEPWSKLPASVMIRVAYPPAPAAAAAASAGAPASTGGQAAVGVYAQLNTVFVDWGLPFAVVASIGLFLAWVVVKACHVWWLFFIKPDTEMLLGDYGKKPELRPGISIVSRIVYVALGIPSAFLAAWIALEAGVDGTLVAIILGSVAMLLIAWVVPARYLFAWAVLMLLAVLAKLYVSSGFVSWGFVAWTTTLVFVVPSGLLIAWVVMRLGYMKNAVTTTTLVFFTLFGLTMIIPFLWMISTAFKTQEATDIMKVQWIPWPIRWANFTDVFTRIPYGRFYLNSLFMSSYVTVGVVFTSALAAYSFARLEFPGRDKIFMAYLATMMIPSAVTYIPVFVLMCKIGWVNSYSAVIVPGLVSASFTFMLRQFFMTLPRDLEDAAKIDGCSLFGIFYRIIVPLSKPALATVTIFSFMGEWGDFMWPLIILNDPDKMPLPVGIQYFQRAEVPDMNVLMCACMLMIVPIIIVFLLGQRYFVEGIQLGAVKG